MKQNYLQSDVIPQNLYFLSDEPIQEGDWILYNIHCGTGLSDYNIINEKAIITTYSPAVMPNIRYCKKIISTTDMLELQYNGGRHQFLPQPTQQFIQYYIDEYNRGNVISEVMVEYEEYGWISEKTGVWKYETHEFDFVKQDRFLVNYRLKVDKNNNISVKAIKNSWNREEVKVLFGRYNEFIAHHDIEEWSNWIKKNI